MTIHNREKFLRKLQDLEIQTIENSKDAEIDLNNCQPSKLFNLIAIASFYRASTGIAEELYPNDLDIQDQVESSTKLLLEKAKSLKSLFEQNCLCTKRK